MDEPADSPPKDAAIEGAAAALVARGRPAPRTLAEVASAPSWLPTQPELDELELALLGIATEITVHVPADVAAATAGAVGLVLTDAEGTPLALLNPSGPVPGQPGHPGAVGPATALTGPISALQPPEHGPFRRLRRSPAEVRAELAGRPAVGVPVDGPLSIDDVAAIRVAAADGAIVLLPLIGAGSPRFLDAAGLVRLTLAATKDDLPGALVVPVPLVRHPDSDADRKRRETVATAYGATTVLQLAAAPGAETALSGRLDRGEDVTDVLPPAVARALQRDYRPPHHRGVAVLFTGLSGSGKSTVARAFTDVVGERFGRTITLLDGDVVRRMLSAGLTFSRPDRELNIRRIGFVAAEIARHGGMAVCCPIAPYASTRADVRQMVEAVGTFVLIHVSTPLEECERRDRKGLYAKARAGEIPEFTGISDPYEEPTDADLAIDTTDLTIEEAVQQVVDLLVARGHLRSDESPE